jgi:hypothetical protein
VLVDDVKRVTGFLEHLQDLGVRTSIDDFGTGYSGLSYLAQMPINTLKIDRSFVQQLGSVTGDQGIVGAIIALAGNLGLDVVAEGVETVPQARALLEHGCGRMQGYLVSPPVAAERVPDLLRRGRLFVWPEGDQTPVVARVPAIDRTLAPLLTDPRTAALLQAVCSADASAVFDADVLAAVSAALQPPTPARPLSRPLSARLATGTFAGLVPLSGGLAAVGALPAPIQGAYSQFLTGFGVPVPSAPLHDAGSSLAASGPTGRGDRAHAGPDVETTVGVLPHVSTTPGPHESGSADPPAVDSPAAVGDLASGPAPTDAPPAHLPMTPGAGGADGNAPGPAAAAAAPGRTDNGSGGPASTSASPPAPPPRTPGPAGSGGRSADSPGHTGAGGGSAVPPAKPGDTQHKPASAPTPAWTPTHAPSVPTRRGSSVPTSAPAAGSAPTSTAAHALAPASSAPASSAVATSANAPTVPAPRGSAAAGNAAAGNAAAAPDAASSPGKSGSSTEVSGSALNRLRNGGGAASTNP